MIAASLLLLLGGLAAQDPVKVQAGLSRSEVRVGETTVLRVDVETPGERAEIERLTRLPPGIELASTRDYDQRQFSIPGGTRRFVSREFVLRARAAGQFRIPALEVTVDGRTYATQSRILTVDDAPPGLRPSAGGSLPEQGVALNAWLDADTVYVGQQVTLNAEAMFSQSARLRLRRAPEYEAPNPSGFWIDELPAQRTSSSRVVEGQVFEVQGFRRALFPLDTGRYVVPPARLEYEMRRGLLYAPETFEVLSDSMPLVVLPVPREGRPPGFTGAVGRFDISASLAPAEVAAGDAAVLTIEVEGVGNIRALPPPALPEMPGVEVFPPSEDAKTRVDGSTIRGTKTFSWVLIPERAGELELAPIRYGYFDPRSEAFATAEAASLTMRVRPGAAGITADTRPATLRYLKTAPEPDRLWWVRSPWFALLQLLPLIAFGAAWAAGRRRGGISRRELRTRLRRGIRDLERRARGDDDRFLADADAFARGWLADRLGIRPAEAGRKAALEAVGAGRGTAAAVAAALDELAALRYAPTPPGPAARTRIVERLAEALRRIDREAPLPGPASRADRPATSRAVPLVLLAAAAGALPGSAAAQQAGQGAFVEGISHFDAGRFDAAAESFRAYARSGGDDPAGWYNLGAAYYRAGHPGHAVLAWLRALRLDPRDGDTRHNLEVAGVAPEVMSRAAPPLPLRPVELALLAAAAWLLAGILGSWWLVRRTRRGGVAAAVALMAAIGFGATWLLSTQSAETLIVLETTTLHAGPTLGADPLEELEPGDGLVPVAAYGEWRRVRTLGGTEGWIENRSAGAL